MEPVPVSSFRGLRIPLLNGVIVEADLETPFLQSQSSVNPSTSNKIAICLHPWSWLGGQKDDPVLATVGNVLQTKNYHVLRYNSRGVGRSSGFPSLTGFSEAEDLGNVIQWALHHISNVDTVVILGYSHGSLIASLQPIMSITTYHVLLSYPYGPRSWLTLFNSSKYTNTLNDLIKNPGSNVLIIYGDSDEFTSTSNYRSWKATLPLPQGNLLIEEVPNATHFWRGQSEHALSTIMHTFLP